MSAWIEIPSGRSSRLVSRWRSNHTSCVFIFNSHLWYSSQMQAKFVKDWHKNDNLMNRKYVNFLNCKLFTCLKIRVSLQGTITILSLASLQNLRFKAIDSHNIWYGKNFCTMVRQSEGKRKMPMPWSTEHYITEENWLMQKDPLYLIPLKKKKIIKKKSGKKISLPIDITGEERFCFA